MRKSTLVVMVALLMLMSGSNCNDTIIYGNGKSHGSPGSDLGSSIDSRDYYEDYSGSEGDCFDDLL